MTQRVVQSIEDHVRVVEAAKASSGLMERAANLIAESFKAGRRLYILGNGGSAADAQHIAAELVGRFKRDDKPALPAISLTTDTSSLTAISNDFGFAEVFRRQVQALVEKDDVLWALSVSGRSPNILAAVQLARDKGANVIGFTGQRGTPLKELCDICFVADHHDSDRVQEAHQLAYHIICAMVEDVFAEAKTEDREKNDG